MSFTIRWAALLVLVGALFSMPATATAQEVVDVTLFDVPSNGWGVSASPSSVDAGSTVFAATNTDTLFEHNLRVIKTDLAPDSLPLNGVVVDEAQVNVVASTSNIPANGGMESTAPTDLAPGSYVLICNVPNHYISGQFVAFQVTGQLPTDTPAPTDTPVSNGTAPTATPDTGVVPTALPVTGAGAPSDSSGAGWWMFALLGAAGLGLSGLAVAVRRAR